MRRTLALTDETRRHPFLASLPPHVRKGIEPIPIKRGWHLSGKDIRGFVLAYSACLLAVGIFIA